MNPEPITFDRGHWLSPDAPGSVHVVLADGTIVGFRNVTAAYHCHKQRVLNEWSTRPWTTATANESRKWARQFAPPSDWPLRRKEVMRRLLLLKFRQNRDLGDRLVATGEQPLFFLTRDRYWGVDHTGRGLNRMGRLLESVRRELQDEQWERP